MTSSLLRRSASLWMTAAGAVGLVIGVTVGQLVGDDGSPSVSNDDTSIGSSTTLDIEQSSTTVAVTTLPVSVPDFACMGPPLSVAPSAVAGVADAGADGLASAFGLEAETESFEYLNVPSHQAEFTSRVLEKAGEGSIVLVAQLSPGPFQKRLAADVVERSRNSVVVVATSDPADFATALDEYPPERSIAVPRSIGDQADFSTAWVSAVVSILGGTTTCSLLGG